MYSLGLPSEGLGSGMGVTREGVGGEGVQGGGEEEEERGEQVSETELVESIVLAEDTPLEESEVHLRKAGAV